MGNYRIDGNMPNYNDFSNDLCLLEDISTTQMLCFALFNGTKSHVLYLFYSSVSMFCMLYMHIIRIEYVYIGSILHNGQKIDSPHIVVPVPMSCDAVPIDHVPYLSLPLSLWCIQIQIGTFLTYLGEMTRMLGYTGYLQYFYQVPGRDLNCGLIALIKEKNIPEMVRREWVRF